MMISHFRCGKIMVFISIPNPLIHVYKRPPQISIHYVLLRIFSEKSCEFTAEPFDIWIFVDYAAYAYNNRMTAKTMLF